MNKIIELAKKIKALADKGVGGEKVNAKDALRKIMEKHNISMEDIEGEQLKPSYFEFDELRKGLFWQVLSTVIKFPKGGVDSYKDAKKPGYIVVMLTSSQAIEMEMKYNFYWRLYKEEYDIWRSAFIQRNTIYNTEAPMTDVDQLSGEALERAKRIMEMSDKIKHGEFRKQIK